MPTIYCPSLPGEADISRGHQKLRGDTALWLCDTALCPAVCALVIQVNIENKPHTQDLNLSSDRKKPNCGGSRCSFQCDAILSVS